MPLQEYRGCLLGGIGLLLAMHVPFLSREGQIWDANVAVSSLSLARQYPGFWLLLGIGIFWMSVSLAQARRPDLAAVWGGAAGSVLTVWLVLSTANKPYAVGPGALLAGTICLLVLASGLSQGGFIRADTFVAASILLLAVFVLVFIV